MSRFIHFWDTVVLQLHRDTESFYHWRSHAFLLFLFLGCWGNSEMKNRPCRYRHYLRSVTAATLPSISPALCNRNRTSTFARNRPLLTSFGSWPSGFSRFSWYPGLTEYQRRSMCWVKHPPHHPFIHWPLDLTLQSIYLPPRSLACDVVSAFYTFSDDDTNGYQIQNCWKCYVTDCKRLIAKPISILR